MSTRDRDRCIEILSQLNSILLRSDRWRTDLSQEALTTGWCGSPPATEEEISNAEARLGVKLPPSYRFFLSISNGWIPFGGFIKRLLPVQEIDRLQSAAPEKLADLQNYYKEDELSDVAYLDYVTPKNVEALRLRYYPESLLLGTGWGVEDDMLLLNPRISTDDGECEAIFFANWIPGNQRFRSFGDWLMDTVKFEANRPG